jgi:methionine-rich copper-binding protein CopC
MKRLLLLAVLTALALPAQAFAHATLEKTSPGFRERLPSSPEKITFRFDQYVQLLPQSVQLFSTRGPLGVRRIVVKGRYLTAFVPRLRTGAYTVRWHAMSGDGHVVSGVFTFGVRVAAPPPTEAFGA